jgi:F-type H+-transporting ATPase subunit alpha
MYEPKKVVASLFIGVKGYCNRINMEHIQVFKKAFLVHMKGVHAGVLKVITDAGCVLLPDSMKKIHDIAEDFTTSFLP